MSQNFSWPAVSVPAPVGGATAANQVLEIAQLTAINSNTAGLLTDTELRASPVAVSIAGSLVPEAFDYQDITYVGATTNINTVVYKSGGSGGTVVATLTMGYDGSNRLTSVTRT